MNTSRKKHSARSRSCVCGRRRLKIDSVRFVARERVNHNSWSRPPSRDDVERFRAAPPGDARCTPRQINYSLLQTQILDLNCSIFRSNIPPRFIRWNEPTRGSAMANLTINGKTIEVDVEPDTPLRWA